MLCHFFLTSTIYCHRRGLLSRGNAKTLKVKVEEKTQIRTFFRGYMEDNTQCVQ